MSKILKNPNAPKPINQTLGEYFLAKANEHSNKICQIDGESGQSETFESTKMRSVRLAMHLKKWKVAPADVILTCAYNSLESALPIIAGSLLGCKIANLHPTLSAWQTKYLINLVEPAVVFVDLDSLALIEEALKDVDKGPKVVVFGKSKKYLNLFDLLSAPEAGEEHFKAVRVNVDNTAVILFSSGTTGLPKGICHSHRSFLAITVPELGNDGIEVEMHVTTFYWISGMVYLMKGFMYGRTRVFCKNSDADVVLSAMKKYKVQCLFTSPFYSMTLINSPNFSNYDTSSLKRNVISGTAISNSQMLRLHDAFPHTRIIYGYGLSECCFMTQFETNLAKNKLKSSGTLLPGVQLKIIDPETSGILGANEKGEICTKSPYLMKGYYKQESCNVLDGDGFLKTGDIGYYDDDGYVYVIERSKEMFKYKSWHVVPTMIETIILDHPAVEQAVVFGLPMNEEEGELPSACITLRKSCNADKEEIKKFVADRVSQWEQLRGVVEFLDDLPKGPTGKILRNEVKNIMVKRLKLQQS